MNKFAYIGNDEISNEFLCSIINERKPEYIITGNDRIEGRGKKLNPSPIYKTAVKNNIQCFKTDNPNSEEFIEKIRKMDVDFFLVFSFGFFLKNNFLKIPKRFSVNIHPSLLPKYRGAAPVNRAIINGDKKTGVTFFKMNNILDAGDIIYQRECDIKENMTSLELFDELLLLAKEMFLEFDWEDEMKLLKQNNENASYAKKIDKKELYYEKGLNAIELNNKINGFSEYGLKASINKINFKIRNSVLNETNSAKEEGLVEINGKEIIVYAKMGSIKIKHIQPSGKKTIGIEQFLNGYKIRTGDKLCAEYSE